MPARGEDLSLIGSGAAMVYGIVLKWRLAKHQSTNSCLPHILTSTAPSSILHHIHSPELSVTLSAQRIVTLILLQSKGRISIICRLDLVNCQDIISRTDNLSYLSDWIADLANR